MNKLNEIQQLIDNLTLEELIGKNKAYYTNKDIANLDNHFFRFLVKLEHILHIDEKTYDFVKNLLEK